MLQEQLMQVYHDHWQSQGDMLTDITRYFRGPDVTTVTSAYENAPIKIALYGKQGLNYDNTLPQFCSGEWTLERILKSYQDFNFGATYFRSPFWENWDLVSTGVFGPTLLGWQHNAKPGKADRPQSPCLDRKLASVANGGSGRGPGTWRAASRCSRTCPTGPSEVAKPTRRLARVIR